MEGSPLWFTKFRLVKWNLVGTGRVDTRVSQQGSPGKAQLACFKEYNKREGLRSHQSMGDTNSIKCSRDGRGKLHPVLLGRQDVGWHNQVWSFPTQNESEDNTGDQRHEVNKDPKAAQTHVAYCTARPNGIVSQLVKKRHETDYSMFNSGKPELSNITKSSKLFKYANIFYFNEFKVNLS